MFKKLFSVISIGVGFWGFSQSVDSKKLDEYFKTLEDNHKIMGSFAIAKDDKIVYTKSVGFADFETNLKSNENTEYRIGSISKTFTAVLVMKAVEENKLQLNDRLSKFFSQIKNADKISIENLLQHRSGIHNFTDDKNYVTWYTNPQTEKSLVSIIEKAGSDFEPNTKYSYSNSNYVLLVYILEKIYKKTYADLIKDKISKPLGLVHTKVGEKINPKNNVANSYSYFDNEYAKENETHMSVPIGAGNLVSTPKELLLFIIALENGKLVNKESLTQMKNFKDHYGFGITEVPFNDRRGFGHNGGIDMSRSVVYYFPDEKVSIAGITNQSNYDNNDISIKLLSAAYGIDYKMPNFNKVEVSEQDIKPFVGIYSHPTFPMKISFFVKDGNLMAQATGQGAFPLEATSKNSFKFDEAGITFEFNAEKNEVRFLQMGQDLIFKKEQQ